MGAAAVIVFTATGSLEWAASPIKAVAIVLVDTAAGIALRTGVITITNSRRLYWRWRRGTRIGGILTLFYRIRGFHCNSTFAC